MTCGLIMDSDATVERIWSIVKNLICAGIYLMSPKLLEEFLLLRYNDHLWDDHSVSESYNGTNFEHINDRIAQIDDRILLSEENEIIRPAFHPPFS